MALKKSQLYSSLWQSCDELRGGMDASQYKDYILTLLFMKYVSDKYAGDPDAMIEVPEGGSFADLVRLKGDKEIGDKINKIIGRLAQVNDLQGVIDEADFNDEDKLGRGKEMRAYANLANEMYEAGYSDAETREIKAEVQQYEKLREEVKLRSADYLDMKVFEPAMRHLLDTYIQAENSEKVSAFDDMTLIELIVERGEDAVNQLPNGLKENPEAMAETIENNVCKVIIDEMAMNPKYYTTNLKHRDFFDNVFRQRQR